MILALLLAGFGLAIVVANQSRVRQEIDADLVRQAVGATRGGRRPPPPPGFLQRDPNQPPGPPDDLLGPRGGPGDGGPGDGGPGGGPDHGPDDGFGPGGPLPAPPNPYLAAQTMADVRRPRFYDASGHPMHSGDNPTPFDAHALAAALAGHPAFANTTADGVPIRVYSHPLIREGHVFGAVQFARELSDLDLLWAAQIRTLAIVLPLAVLAAAAAAFALTGRTLRPVARLTATAADIGRSGDLSRRLDATGEDEIARLARTFNEMLGRLEGSFRDQQEAFARLNVAYEQQRRFAADASHELRTPLTRLRLAAGGTLGHAASPEEMVEALRTVDRAAETMTKLVGQLLTLARADDGQTGPPLEPVDLRVVVSDALGQSSNPRPVSTSFDDAPVMILGDAESLARVVLNLVENALRHTPETGSVTVETRNAGGEACVIVRDTGEGIPREHLPHLGERFYRVDPARTRKDGGAGLGLAICLQIVRTHRGRLEFASEVGQGTTVRAIFPLISPSAPEAVSTK